MTEKLFPGSKEPVKKWGCGLFVGEAVVGADYWWLRSSYRDNDNNVYNVNNGGDWNNNNADNDNNCLAPGSDQSDRNTPASCHPLMDQQTAKLAGLPSGPWGYGTSRGYRSKESAAGYSGRGWHLPTKTMRSEEWKWEKEKEREKEKT